MDPLTFRGLRRVRHGAGFAYLDARGHRVCDAATLDRIRKLVIPPAWTDVWICSSPHGHIQAVGRDARGRRQYRYHARWREVRDANKFHRMLAFAGALPRIRGVASRDLRRRGLTHEKVLAAAVRLLELTHMRIGHEEYTRANGSYGLTTLRDRHVHIRGADVRFRYRGKSGKMRDIGVHDRSLARVVATCSELPGHELFQYLDANGSHRSIDSEEVNRYIREAAGEDFTAKDFRTWAGTVLAARMLRAIAPCASHTRARRSVVECIRSVAAELGNTPAICKRSYVHPAVIDAFLDGSLASVRQARGDEAFVRALLRRVERAR